MNSIPIAIYVKQFLPISQTFVYRQLTGVEPKFAPHVICKKQWNRDVYPYQKVYSRSDMAEDVLLMARRAILGYNDTATDTNYRFWSKVIKENSCRLIHTHFGDNGITMMPLARMTGLPLVVSLHGYGISKLLGRRGYKESLKKLFREAALIITGSEHFGREAEKLGCPREKIRPHHIGVPVDKFPFRERKLNPGEPIITIQVSSFNPKKGHIYTIRAFKKVVEAGVDARLILVGNGPTRGKCEKLVADLNLAKRVEFTGSMNMNQIPSQMDRGHIFVHHSVTAPDGDTEATTLTIAEAMSCGMPVIATNHGGIPEEIREGETGFLVEEKDVDTYAKKWITLARDPEMIQKMGIQGRKLVEKSFNLEIQNQELKKIYQSVLNDTRPPEGE